VGQDEDPHPLVRRANFCRAEQARRRRVAHAPKLSQDGFKAECNMPGDVFEEHPFWATFANDAGDFWPEVTGIVCAAAFTSGAERLAGVSGQHSVECTAERPGIEAAQIVPDRGLGEIPCALGGDENGSGPAFPLDKGAGVKARLGEHEAQIKASAACAERQSVPGT
jgi:hypothetical protein